MKNLLWTQDWFESNCNGDWEHEHQIKITTIDNPGWNVFIEFGNSDVNINNSEWKLIDNGENDWYGWKVSNCIFEASCDIIKLDSIFFSLLIFNQNIIYQFKIRLFVMIAIRAVKQSK
jgi:hypothetical protein